MTRMIGSCGLMLAMAFGVIAADSQQAKGPPNQPPAKGPTAPLHPGFEQLKKLVGVWVSTDEKGKPTGQIVSVFKMTASGSAVHETIFPGTPSEMVTVYHLDGPDLVLTHFCAAGNQPRMKADPNLRADPKIQANQLRFYYTGGTNLDPKKDQHMHDGFITVHTDDLIDWAWVGWANGQPAQEHLINMRLARRKEIAPTKK